MVLIMKPIGVDEMGVGAAKLGGAVIHHFGKGTHASGHMLCQSVGNLVGGF